MTEFRIPDVVINPSTHVAQIGAQEVYIASNSITTSVEDGCMYLTLTLPVRSIAWKQVEQ